MAERREGGEEEEHGSERALGVALQFMEEPGSALRCHTRQLQECERLADVTGQAQAHADIGLLLSAMGHSLPAAKSFLQALQCASRSRDIVQECGALVGLGMALLEEGEREGARRTMEHALAVLEDACSDLSMSSDARDQLLEHAGRALKIMQLLHVRYRQRWRRRADNPKEKETEGERGGSEQEQEQEQEQELSAKEKQDSLIVTVQLQAFEQLVAMGEGQVIDWRELEEELEFDNYSEEDVKFLLRCVRKTIVVVSPLDDDGTIGSWIISPFSDDIAFCYSDTQNALEAHGHSWNSLLDLTLNKLPHMLLASDGNQKNSQTEQERMFRCLYDVCWRHVAAQARTFHLPLISLTV
eukprot:762407-Hanusia_phi.AAC.3